MSSWVELVVFSSKAESEVAKSALESAGIPVQIRADDQGGMRPQLAVTAGIKVFVPKEKLEEAKALLNPKKHR